MKLKNTKKYIVWLPTLSLVFASIMFAPKVLAQSNDTSTENSGSSNTNSSGNPGTTSNGNGTTIVPVPVSYNNGMDLGQLLIYDQLFRNGNTTIGGFRARNLGDLVLMSNLFGGTNGSILGGSNGTILGNGYTTTGGLNTNNLGNLFVLDRLFGSNVGHSSIFTGSNGNLGDLYLLNQLFNR